MRDQPVVTEQVDNTLDPNAPLLQAALYASLGPLGRTIIEALILTGLNLTLIGFLQLAHLWALLPSKGNTESLEMLGKMSPVALLLTGVILAPLLEESCFRGLPLLLFRAVTGLNQTHENSHRILYWSIGGMAAVAFAFAHISLNSGFHLPVPQLLFGLWSWRIVNTRGLRYSMLLHGIYNLCLMTMFLAKH